MPKNQKTLDDGVKTETGSEQPKQVGAITPLKKITIKTVCGTPSIRDLPADGSEVVCMKVAGYAAGTKQGETQYGTWNALLGEFAATNMGTGEVFMAKSCLLPDALGEALVDTVTAKLQDDASSKVAFRVMVSVKISQRDPNKYEYVTRPLMDVAFASPAMLLLTEG